MSPRVNLRPHSGHTRRTHPRTQYPQFGHCEPSLILIGPKRWHSAIQTPVAIPAKTLPTTKRFTSFSQIENFAVRTGSDVMPMPKPAPHSAARRRVAIARRDMASISPPQVMIVPIERNVATTRSLMSRRDTLASAQAGKKKRSPIARGRTRSRRVLAMALGLTTILFFMVAFGA